jgi:hypothetical protein
MAAVPAYPIINQNNPAQKLKSSVGLISSMKVFVNALLTLFYTLMGDAKRFWASFWTSRRADPGKLSRWIGAGNVEKG